MPAYTFRAIGTVAQNSNSTTLSPGAPAGKAAGDLLLAPTVNYNDQTVPATPSGWTVLFNDADGIDPRIILFGKVADGTAGDTPTFDWGGNADSAAWILAYSGDVYTDMTTIVAHTATQETTGNSGTALPAPALTVTTDDCMLFSIAVRRKTSTSNDATTISHAQFQKRAQLIQTGTAIFAAIGDLQQTTATNYDGTNWTRDGTTETGTYVGIVLALRTAAAVLAARGRMLMTGIG